MGTITLNFTNESAQKNLVPEGEYVCGIDNIQEKQTKAGDTMWSVRFRIVEGQFANRCLFELWVFAATTLPRISKILSVFDMKNKGEVAIEPTAFIGKKCLLTIVHKTNDDITREVVKYWGYKRYQEDKA
jgi:hypothetical protein